MLCRICVIHIQPRNHILGHADCTAPAQHDVDDTDQGSVCPERARSCTVGIEHTDQEYVCPEQSTVDVEVKTR